MRRCVSFDRGCRTHDQFHDKTMGFAVLLAIMTCLYSASAGGQLLHSTLLAGAPAALLRVDANVAVQKVALRKHLWMVVLCRAACVRALCGHRIKRVRPVADMAGAVCLRAGSCWASGTGPSCFPCRLWSVPLAPCLSVCTRAFVCMCALASRVDCGPCLCLPVSLSITGFEKLSASGSSRCLSVCTRCRGARKRARTHRRRTTSTISCRRRPRGHCCHWGRTTDPCRHWARSRWSWSRGCCFRALSQASSACSPAPACPSCTRKNKNPPRSRARGSRGGARRRAGAAELVRAREEPRCWGMGL